MRPCCALLLACITLATCPPPSHAEKSKFCLIPSAKHLLSRKTPPLQRKRSKRWARGSRAQVQRVPQAVPPNYMDSLCKDHFLQRQYRKLDGGVLWSRNERNLDCTVTFQTHSILQRFMLHFALLQLDCNDHLYVYDGAHDTAPPKADLSCRNTKQQVGALFTRSNFVTLKYVTDNWGTDANGFKLVITAVKDPKHGCKQFRCKQREFCVSADLTCDGVDHCADGSDEDTATLCPESGGSGAWGAWAVVAGASTALLAAAVAAAACCLCRRRNDTTSHLQLQQMVSSNGGGGGGKGLTEPLGVALLGDTRLPGNWALPAGQHRAKRPGPLRPPAT